LDLKCEAENDQHPDVHRETRNDRTHGAEAQGVLQGGGPAPRIRQEAHGMGAEDDAQEAGGGQDALLVQRRLEVALHLVHDQAHAHDLHHYAHEAQSTDQHQLVVEAAHSRQRDGLLEGVWPRLRREGLLPVPRNGYFTERENIGIRGHASRRLV